MSRSLFTDLRGTVRSLGFVGGALFGWSGLAAGAGTEPVSVSDQYRLAPLDQVKIVVQGEQDMTVERKLDSRGNFNVPLLGPVKLSGLSVADAQDLIAKRYVQGEIFIHPEVVVSITAYSPRDVVVLGQVTATGKVPFKPEDETMSIVTAIASAGGFTQLAATSAVRVTRKDENGKEQTITVDVAKMINGHRSQSDGTTFEVQPGDVVFVPERRF